MNKNLLFSKLFLVVIVLMNYALAQYDIHDIKKLKNDKELFSRLIKNKEMAKIKAQFQNEDENVTISNIFYNTVLNFLNSNDGQCEGELIKKFKFRLKGYGKPNDQEDLDHYFKMLRAYQYIDDIFLEILMSINLDVHQIEKIKFDKDPRIILLKRDKFFSEYDVTKLFSSISTWPDDKNSCYYDKFFSIKKRTKKDFDEYLKKARKQNLITNESYYKLKYLNEKSNVFKRDVWLTDYLNSIIFAKNVLNKREIEYTPINIENENAFSTERIKRFSKLTRRKLLYSKYNKDQIIQLAQILQKASKRMGVEPGVETSAPVIIQEFSYIDENNIRQTYVEKETVNPEDQFDYARKRLRNDMLELQMMDTFANVDITFNDIVMASLETGYITLEEIELVVKYDDLWNPEISAFSRVKDFVFTVLGFTTFYLPPPWNISASIALGVVSGVIDNKRKTGENNDNPKSYF